MNGTDPSCRRTYLIVNDFRQRSEFSESQRLSRIPIQRAKSTPAPKSTRNSWPELRGESRLNTVWWSKLTLGRASMTLRYRNSPGPAADPPSLI